jgi:integrase
MARRRTGTIETFTDAAGKTKYRARLRLGDGSRPRRNVPPEYGYSEARAREWAARMQEEEDAHGETLKAQQGKMVGHEGESAASWFDRYFTWRKGRGFATTRDVEARLRTYALPHLGTKPMTAIGRDDIEAIVAALDERVSLAATSETVRFSWKTAANVCGDVTCAFDEACNSKDRSLRVLKVDPCAGVRGPERGDDRAKPFLYPSELVALLGCEAVPIYWRRMYAVAAYTGMRSNELAALRGTDVDLEHLKIDVSKQADRRTGLAKPTKTRRVRSVDIEPHLLPLVAQLARAAGEGKLLRMPPDEDRAELLRKHLTVAGCTRPALEADALRAPMKFHGLRDTCLSHMAVRGDDPLRIQWRAGHTQFATTQKYIDQARKVAGGFGSPFPPLPGNLLLAGDHWSNQWSNEEGVIPDSAVDSERYVATPTGIEDHGGGWPTCRESCWIFGAAA